MADYIYTREIVNGNYDINNPLDVDENGIAVPLFNRVETALPGRGLEKVDLAESVCTITMDTLNDADKETLDNTVAAHKAADGSVNHTDSIILSSPNGNQWEITVDNSGNLLTQNVT